MSVDLLSAIVLNGPDPLVDLVRLSLEGTSAHWFRWVLIWGYVVALGCVMEVPETVVAIKGWYKARFRNVDLPKDSSWRIPVSAIGLLFVIAGVAGETICESLVSTAETALRTHESQILADAELKSGQAQLDAGTARQNAIQIGKDTEALKTEAENAKRDMVKAQLELARLNGPPYIVPVSKDGVATPDLSKGNKQFVLLRKDTKIVFPLMPKGKSLAWTLFIAQDETGGHQFAFSPQLNWPGNNIFFDSCVADIVTTDAQTIDRTLGGAVCTMSAKMVRK